MTGKKVQVPVLGGLRKVINVGSSTQTNGTTITEFANQTISLAQLKAALGITTPKPNTVAPGASAAITVGPGLAGGGPIVGTVPIQLIAPIPAFVFDDGGGNDGDPGPPGQNGAAGAQGPMGPAVFLEAEPGQDGTDGIPGGVGPQGATGAVGPTGSVVFLTAEDGQDADWGPPGGVGPAGATGAAGGIALINSASAGSNVASLSVSSIPNTYSHLWIVFVGRSSAGTGASDVQIQFNGDTGANYDYEYFHSYDSGTAFSQHVGQTQGVFGNCPTNAVTSTRVGTCQALIGMYGSTTFDKQGASNWGNNLGTSGFNIGAGAYGFTWRPSTPAAITSILVKLAAGNIATGSKLWVYGVP